MHGLGNDFVVIDLITQGARLNSNHIRRIADRRFGIGCDQVILITPPTRADADFFYRIYNADGTEVEQCGNGVRCAAKFFLSNGLTNKNVLYADCLGGSMQLEVDILQQNVTVNLGKNYSPVTTHQIHHAGLPPTIHSVNVGNQHGVCIVDDINSVALAEWGKILSKEPIFPKEANISFMQVIDKDNVVLRVYERGVGPTLACGSAACASLLVGKFLNLTNDKIQVAFAHGNLSIAMLPDQTLSMTGPAISVYIGRFRV